MHYHAMHLHRPRVPGYPPQGTETEPQPQPQRQPGPSWHHHAMHVRRALQMVAAPACPAAALVHGWIGDEGEPHPGSTGGQDHRAGASPGPANQVRNLCAAPCPASTGGRVAYVFPRHPSSRPGTQPSVCPDQTNPPKHPPSRPRAATATPQALLRSNRQTRAKCASRKRSQTRQAPPPRQPQK